jgi:hypothetical protein
MHQLPSLDLHTPLAFPQGVKYVHKLAEASNTTHRLGNITLVGVFCSLVMALSKSSPVPFATNKMNL